MSGDQLWFINLDDDGQPTDALSEAIRERDEARAWCCGSVDGCSSLHCQLCLARDTMRRLSDALQQLDAARALHDSACLRADLLEKRCDRLEAEVERMRKYTQWRCDE